MTIGQIITYDELRAFAGFQIQHGMNHGLPNGKNIFLMSIRENAPYEDQISDDGSTIEYEGHNEKRSVHCSNPDLVDQPRQNKGGTYTPNGEFEKAALAFKNDGLAPCKIEVFNKIKKGLWSFCGVFNLVDVNYFQSGQRKVFRFKLVLCESDSDSHEIVDLKHDRVIPSDIQATVFNRDKGRCIQCGATDNLHFDHILPYSKGGSSKKAENIQLLCARHNLSKGNKFK